MHFSSALCLASLVLATPIAIPEGEVAAGTPLVERQLTGATENDLVRGRCGDVIFIFARGSTEIGNMGTVVGPGVATQLKRRVGSQRVAVQGVDYAALVSTNFLPGGTDAISEAEMKRLFNLADTRCPDSQIVVGGYSQGGAVVHRAMEDLSQNVRNKVQAVVLFGDTQKRIDRDQVPGFPTEKTKFFCAGGLDQVCNGVLNAAVLAPHLSYGSVAVEAGNFLADRVV
ncbi:cutinase [Xylaria bambusicola]|uniref:cutinase n=1 Tax=Xylaria bambusicola TaxID=326684 RepID=UPI0020074484|nr:cutinase [Xylaria bambusicola]KAI0502744.1 cutinase [Xylaria bambusicola]